VSGDLTWAEVAALLPPEAAAALAQRRAGRRVYIPARPRPGQELVVCIGLAAAEALAAEYGGLTVEVSPRLARDAQIRALTAAGLSQSQIAHRLLLSVDTVRRVQQRGDAAAPAMPSAQMDLFG